MTENDGVTLEREVRECLYKDVTLELKHPKDRLGSFISFSSFFLLLFLFPSSSSFFLSIECQLWATDIWGRDNTIPGEKPSQAELGWNPLGERICVCETSANGWAADPYREERLKIMPGNIVQLQEMGHCRGWVPGDHNRSRDAITKLQTNQRWVQPRVAWVNSGGRGWCTS